MVIRGQNLSPQNLAPLVDSEFDVYYDFDIKHDLIQSDDWVVDFCVMLESHLVPKITIMYTLKGPMM